MKKVLLIFIILLLTGCTTEVTLRIDADKVNETIKIYGLKSEVYLNDIINDNIQSNLNAFEREYEFYNIQEFENQQYVGKIYELSETAELWSELSHLRPCYDTFKLEKNDFSISLETSEEYRCGYLFGANDVVLTVESDLNLISSNADRIVGNKLTWYINNNNYKNKNIRFNYSITNYSNNADNKGYELLIYLSIACLVILVVLFVIKRNKENNKI